MSKNEALVVGSGGREDELIRQLNNSDELDAIYVVGGNAGIKRYHKAQIVKGLQQLDLDNIVAFASEKDIGLTVIGPEAPIVAGLGSRLRAKGLAVLAPSFEAAQIEGSKAYATAFMEKFNIPHPPTVITYSYQEAISQILGRRPTSYVIKADGLAGGKGVVVPTSSEEATLALERMFANGFNEVGRKTVLIQKRFHGPEITASVLSDGKRFVALPFSQDHKRLLEGDQGPNTGGMGAYAPVPAVILNADQEQKIHEITERSIQGMAYMGAPYQGVLYIGCMLAEELGGDPVVIEYNARFGDPEAQVILPLLSEAGIDVHDLLRSTAEGHLRSPTLSRRLGKAALSVCLAAEGYPEDPQGGRVIYSADKAYSNVIIHHAGTAWQNQRQVTVGGRVLYITSLGGNVGEAARSAYSVVNRVGFMGMQYRKDIGYQARANTTASG